MHKKIKGRNILIKVSFDTRKLYQREEMVILYLQKYMFILVVIGKGLKQ